MVVQHLLDDVDSRNLQQTANPRRLCFKFGVLDSPAHRVAFAIG